MFAYHEKAVVTFQQLISVSSKDCLRLIISVTVAEKKQCMNLQAVQSTFCEIVQNLR